MTRTTRSILLLFMGIALFFFAPSEKLYADGFDFYYVSINETVEIAKPYSEIDSPLGKVKNFFKKTGNAVKRFWSQNIDHNFIQKEGERLYYSKSDKNLAYSTTKTKVTSEEHLLELMGADSESDLTNGQKALLASYRMSKSEAVKKREDMSLFYMPKVNVVLVDTTGFEDAEEYPHARKDFWPNSTGFTITMNSGRYRNNPNAERDASSTFLHEYAHCLDSNIRERKGYGPDGTHYINEITMPRAAFVEAWAEYNEMLEFPHERRDFFNVMKGELKEEGKKAGDYTYVKPEDATGDQLMCSEAFLACMLYRIADEVEGGEEKINKAFKDIRWCILRDISNMLKQLVKNNPDDAKQIAGIVDEITLGKLSDKEMMHYLGKSSAIKEFLEERAQKRAEEEAAAESDAAEDPEAVEGAPAEKVLETVEDNVPLKNAGSSGGVFDIK